MYDVLPMTIGRYYEDRDLLAFIDTLSEEPDKSLEESVEVLNVVEEGRYCQEIGPIFLDERAGFKPGDKVRIIIIKDVQ